jgi:hypothetical protein
MHYPKPASVRKLGSKSELERNMAKGQKKSNKEVRKPKADKTKSSASVGPFSNGSTTTGAGAKGKD